MISLEVSDVADAKWNKRLEDASLGSIHQTNEFAIYTRKVFNQKPKFIKFLNSKGDIVGQLLLHEYSRFAKKGISGKFLKKILGSKDTIFRWKYGPIIFKYNLADDVWKSLYDFPAISVWSAHDKGGQKRGETLPSRLDSGQGYGKTI